MSEFIKTSRFDILLIALDTAKRAGAGVELSELGVVALVEEIATLQSRIAELEVFIDKLIEAGNTLDYWVVHFRSKEGATTSTQIKWAALIADWKKG